MLYPEVRIFKPNWRSGVVYEVFKILGLETSPSDLFAILSKRNHYSPSRRIWPRG